MASHRRLALLAALQAATLPALGIPMFFRNEAAWHWLLWKRTAFFDLFDGFLTSRSSMSNAVVSRPLVRILEWVQVRSFGLHSTAYVVVNGLLFMGFAAALFDLGAVVFGAAATGVLAALLLAACFQVTFYPVLNAIHGLQYPLEMLLVTLSLGCFVRAFEGAPRRAVPGVILFLLACVSHAASAVVVPLAVATLGLASPGLARRRRAAVVLLSPLAIGIAFALERQGVPGGLATQAGLAAKLEFAVRQAAALGALTLKLPGGPVLLAAAAFDVAGLVMSRRVARDAAGTAVASLAAGAVLWFVLRPAPLAGLAVVAGGLALGVVRRRRAWFLATWMGAGVLLFVATPEQNASYARHFVVPAALVAADALRCMLAAILALRPASALRAVRLDVASGAAAILLFALLGAASRFPVPGLSPKLEQLRYVRDLGLAFRDGLTRALVEVPPGGTLGFFAGRSREDEMRSLYGADYFARLQPAKADHYDDFTALLGRPDVHVVLVDPDRGPWPAGCAVLAVNTWEADRMRVLCGCEPERLQARGRAAVWRAGARPGSGPER